MWRTDILQELQLGCIICSEAPVIQFIQIEVYDMQLYIGENINRFQVRKRLSHDRLPRLMRGIFANFEKTKKVF